MASFSSTDERTALAGVLAGQYEIEREIGRGGMGVVYLARDPRLDRMVAIKTLPPAHAGDATTRDRFLREARTVARLAHPNIVPIHRADEIGGTVFFVMGFVDGDSLAARLARGPLSPREAVPILRDVVAALGYAHRNGVIHRDVKIENILLESATGRAMVTDFGIARVAEAAPLTATGQVLGTVYYLSPEQVIGGHVDARSDIYALGVVAYAALAGRFPFDGPLASAVLVSHVNALAPPLAVAAPHVPASLASIVDRCLAKDPARRFQTCADLDAALAGAQADAERVAIAPRATPSPLVSDTEALAVFGRAAELQESTVAHPRPAVQRDAERDAQRTSGFKTTDLREAAREAGIDESYMQRALVEHGLRPQPTNPSEHRPLGIVHDLSHDEAFPVPASTDLAMELIVEGEVAHDDMDLLADVVRRQVAAQGYKGTAASVGRSFNWSGRTSKCEIEVSVVPRDGRTTIRVAESLGPLATGGYIIGAVVSAMISFNIIANGDQFAGLVIGMGLVVGGYALLSSLLRDYARERKEAITKLVKELAAQVPGRNKPDRR